MNKEALLGKEYQIDPTANWRSGHIERARGGDGYDVMGKVEAEKWHAVAGWGSDGWDLGDWPYVVIYVRRGQDEQYQVAYYVEGDVTIYEYATKEEAFGAIDALAFFHWKHHDSREPDVSGVESVDDLPPRLCGPYGKDRSEEVTA